MTKLLKYIEIILIHGIVKAEPFRTLEGIKMLMYATREQKN